MAWLDGSPAARLSADLQIRSRPRRRRTASAWRPASGALLEDLALGLDRRRDDQLGLLQLADAARADRAHAGPDRADQVERAVLGEGRAEQDLLERSGDAHPDARAARQVGVRRRHAPVVAAARRLVGAREGRADHDRVGARGERLADVAARRHAAVGDDRHVAAGPLVVEVARGRGVGGGGHLRHAEAEHLAARAGRARARRRSAARPRPSPSARGRPRR